MSIFSFLRIKKNTQRRNPPQGYVDLVYNPATGQLAVREADGSVDSLGGSSGPVQGVTDGSDAAPGVVGEYQSDVGSMVSLPNGDGLTVASIEITPGDWDVFGGAYFEATAADIIQFAASVGGADDIINTNPGEAAIVTDTLEDFSGTYAFPVPSKRFNITVNTTVYFVVRAIFAGGTVAGNGQLYARRVR
jgi:hypothetical protein